MNRIPIYWPTCEVCGCPLPEPGLCAHCASQVQTVDHVTRVLEEKCLPGMDCWAETVPQVDNNQRN